MHGLSIYEIKRICHRAHFVIISHGSFQHLVNFIDVTQVLNVNVYLYEVIQHYNAKKRRKKQMCANLGIDPGPLIPNSNTLTTRLQGQVVSGSK